MESLGAALTLLPLIDAGSKRAVGWTMMGALLVLLGVAPAFPEWAALSGAPVSFLAVSAGLVLLGVGAIVYGAAWWGGKESPLLVVARYGQVGTGVANAVRVFALIYLLDRCWPLIVAAGWWGLLAAFGLGGSFALVWTLLQIGRVGRWGRWLDERWLARKWSVGQCLPLRARQVVFAVILFAAVTVVLSANLLVAVTGAMIAVVGTHRLLRETGRAPAIPVQPVVAAAGLLLFAWLAATIAGGEVPLSLPGILDSPLSETAEALLALLLGIGAWALLGLFPFHGVGPGSGLALVGGAMLLRWGTGFIYNGMAHAAPLFAVVAGVAVLHAASTGRVGEYLAALGVLALGSGVGTWWLFGVASLMAVMRLLALRSPVPGLDRRQLGGIAMLPALASVLPSAIRGETFVTALAILAGVALFRPTND
ncbi:MAG TPA: hypothetical protein VG940_00465 [Gemmatimonadales bacterium]|nr:hypothetical protein [Gemmatimonadales bacterium]